MDELKNHQNKLIKISKLSGDELEFLKRIFLKKIELIDLENLPSERWEKSVELVKDIDEFDAPFIALSLELKAPLWTGDKKLMNSLKKKDFDLILDTNTILRIRDKG